MEMPATGSLLMLSLFTATKAVDIEGVKVQELNSESFTICHNKTEMSCPGSEQDLKIRLLSCGFTCLKETVYNCKEDKDRGIIEFCAKPEKCNPGLMNKVYFDDKHQKVVIEKVSCPVDFYQPSLENCYIACTQFRHVDKELLKLWGIKVLFEGNSTHPGVGYCDVDQGFVSSDNKMYRNLTDNEIIQCVKPDDLSSICGEDKRLLPDGSCGDICESGYVVDKKNSFKCSKQSDDNRSVILKSTAQPAQVHNTTPNSARISSKNHITPYPDVTSTQQNAPDVKIIVIAVLVPVTVLFIILGICGYVWCKDRRKRSYSRTERRGSDSGESHEASPLSSVTAAGTPDNVMSASGVSDDSNEEEDTEKPLQGEQRSTRTTKYIGCRSNSFKTKNGNIIINVNKSLNSSTETGVFFDNRSESNSEEGDQSSQESGFIAGQLMDELKSSSHSMCTAMDMEDISNFPDDDVEETKLMEVV